jgi:hypothetical protein
MSCLLKSQLTAAEAMRVRKSIRAVKLSLIFLFLPRVVRPSSINRAERLSHFCRLVFLRSSAVRLVRRWRIAPCLVNPNSENRSARR